VFVTTCLLRDTGVALESSQNMVVVVAVVVAALRLIDRPTVVFLAYPYSTQFYNKQSSNIIIII
jgi:hypothetical protein